MSRDVCISYSSRDRDRILALSASAADTAFDDYRKLNARYEAWKATQAPAG
jgi:hypothetical protein